MSHFFAYLSKMKFIQRWGLTYTTHSENIQEHSFQVAIVAHNLALIRNRLFEGNVNPERVAILALYHDVSEVITGDMPAPIKYFNPEIKTAYKAIEAVASLKLLNMVPTEFKDDYQALLLEADADHTHHRLVKAADTLCAYLKSVEEIRSGNQEYVTIEKQLKAKVNELNLPEVQHFLEVFAPSFNLILDDLN
ncbi:MAG: 5'-deoxynucleotidase [Chloroflexota bacterium]